MGWRDREWRFDFAASTPPELRDFTHSLKAGETIAVECFGGCGRIFQSTVYTSGKTGRPTYNKYCPVCWQAKEGDW